MTYLIKFYSKARGEVRERRVDAPNEQTAVKAICNYYGVSNDDIREIIELKPQKLFYVLPTYGDVKDNDRLRDDLN